jgi:hypothetical protein
MGVAGMAALIVQAPPGHIHDSAKEALEGLKREVPQTGPRSVDVAYPRRIGGDDELLDGRFLD